MGFLFSKLSPLKPFSWLDSKEGEAAGFDVIIIGSGPAGCVLANRMSEGGKHRVLLVEAGVSNEKKTFTKIPATWTKNMWTSIDWQYYTTGKVLGGSSSINALIYHHGAPSDYDAWVNEGAAGWGYKELAPYFKKAEHHTPHEKHGDLDLEHRGSEGPWHTGFHWPSPGPISSLRPRAKRRFPIGDRTFTRAREATPRNPLGVSGAQQQKENEV
ncbi:GMC oxidoreductase [Calocera viscosa TUFC12733]|uniref:GMC oxidoreductase n=1 Tax=Calocera viscosa (strain TUFC12733) TaxID=1330018 RepID=A0A167KE99_CALVF|nr:GMC oxidoreductase [Calocera viscosa TUFC12733]